MWEFSRVTGEEWEIGGISTERVEAPTTRWDPATVGTTGILIHGIHIIITIRNPFS